MTSFRAAPRTEVFEELVRRHAPAAHRTALAIMGSAADAEDAVQECFLRLIRRRATYRPGARFSVWFHTVLRNICRDEIRRAKRAVPSSGSRDGPAHEPDSSSRAERGEQAREATRAFDRLPRAERELLALRIHDGLRFSEIAEVVGISEEAAKKRAQRALDRLRRALAHGRRGSTRGPRARNAVPDRAFARKQG